jgi:hypothetical protein
MKIPQIIRNVKMFNQKTVDLQNISGISHPRGIGFAPMKPASRFMGQAFHWAGRPTKTHTDSRAESNMSSKVKAQS